MIAAPPSLLRLRKHVLKTAQQVAALSFQGAERLETALKSGLECCPQVLRPEVKGLTTKAVLPQAD